MAVKRKSIDRLTYIVMGVFIVLAIITAVVAFNVARDVFKSWTSTSLEGVPVAESTQEVLGTPLPGDTVFQEATGPTPTPWDGKTRVTVLVMGLDYRDWEDNEGGPARTDTMILFTLDPVSNTAGILSIPRDMWVNIPGYDYYRINQAYFLGDADNLPGGGPALAMETVRQFLGVDINYYAQVDFNAFVKFIDTIDGVKINVPEAIKVQVIGKDQPVTLDPGIVTLPGDIALAYARNRYTEGSDFDRAKRQQQVIIGIRDRVTDFNMLPKLIARSATIYNDLSSGIKTNMSMDDIMRLAWSAIQVPKENILQAQFGPDTVQFANVNGQDVLIPVTDEIRLVRDQVFTSTGPVGPLAVGGDSADLMKEEQARVSVQNGSGVDGVGGATSDWLGQKGVSVTDQSNADGFYDVTTFYVYNGKPYTLSYLSEVMGIENPRVYNRYDPNAAYDIAVVLGGDWANANPMQ